ncbi:probable glycosyltransferase At5g25310 [Salvia miltiorrhiza]|uniref:probable glycosyltransferase At5g25310 n=1 Tax=Salvia miltiorrhiza TaxID=226208 RepID=UPI0025AB80FC|nr:probable glycosyltransferase At5g25310 [Salvia miltiorrhiza]
METRRLLWYMALAFSLVLMVQYIKLPYGYVMSSLLSIGKSGVASAGSFSINETGSSANPVFSGGPSQNVTNLLGERKPETSNDHVVERSSNDFLEMNLSNKSLAAEPGGEQLVHELPESSYTTVKNSTADSLQGTDAVPSSIIDEERASPSHAMSPARERPSLRHGQLSTEVNSSAIRRAPRSARLKGSPAVVVPISEMNDLLRQSRVSYHLMNARWPSQADEELLNAKRLIESADSVKKNPRVDVSIYRNFSAFTRSYELMEQTLKIYIYSEGERPVFHEPKLNGIYASEGWFMKQLQESKHFVTKNGNKAHLFYLPFSSHVLQEVLYVPGSHSRKNLVRYLSSYLKNITSTHRFWDRTNGTDHFLVACHDWAPAETGRIMSNCIRALCNANVMGGFRFGRDVSLPETYVRNAMSPLKDLGGKPPSQRHVLAFFAGKMHGYLRPLLLDYWEGKDPDMKISGKLQKGKDRTSYAQYMKSSKYCISAKGYEPYTPRVVEAIFYECVPVILSDNYVPPFFETLDWESFAVFILERDIPNLKKILESIPEKRYVEMQQRVRLVQKHFLWHDKPMKFDIFHMVLHSLWYTRVLQMGA